jgi:hypothetical protein
MIGMHHLAQLFSCFLLERGLEVVFGFELRLHASRQGTLPLEPHLQHVPSFFIIIIEMKVSITFCPG